MTDFALMLQGIVILSDRILPNGYVAVADGRIAEVGQGHPPSARESHHLGAALILPGAIDAQVHSLSQRDQEDFIWSTRAAAAGGVTTIVDMPYEPGRPWTRRVFSRPPSSPAIGRPAMRRTLPTYLPIVWA